MVQNRLTFNFRAQEYEVSAPGKGDDEVFLLLLHHVEQDLDRLLAVVFVVGRVVEVIRLVDQQDTTERLLDHFLPHASERGQENMSFTQKQSDV